MKRLLLSLLPSVTTIDDQTKEKSQKELLAKMQAIGHRIDWLQAAVKRAEAVELQRTMRELVLLLRRREQRLTERIDDLICYGSRTWQSQKEDIECKIEDLDSACESIYHHFKSITSIKPLTATRG